MYYGTDSIPQNIPHIQTGHKEYFEKYLTTVFISFDFFIGYAIGFNVGDQ